LVSSAFQILSPQSYEKDSFLTGPYASFVGKIYETVEQKDNDCKFGINLLEYNNFDFGNKERMEFKIQAVYETGPRFKNLAQRLSIGKFVFISGLFDLNENETPFILAKEIDLLDDSSINTSTNQTNINPQSPFSRTNKFKNNKPTIQNLPSTSTENTKNNKESRIINIKKEDESTTTSGTLTSDINSKQISEKQKKGTKRKKEIDYQSTQQLKNIPKKSKIRTRSQKKESDEDENVISTEQEEST